MCLTVFFSWIIKWRWRKQNFQTAKYSLDTNINNQKCHTSTQHPYVGILKQLYNDPSDRHRHTQTRDNHRRTTPMVRREPPLPIQSCTTAHIIRTIAHFTTQEVAVTGWRRRCTLNQPSFQTLMVYTGYVTGACARLYQWFGFVGVVTDPALFGAANEGVTFCDSGFRIRFGGWGAFRFLLVEIRTKLYN